jgi:hypothetical protein
MSLGANTNTDLKIIQVNMIEMKAEVLTVV